MIIERLIGPVGILLTFYFTTIAQIIIGRWVLRRTLLLFRQSTKRSKNLALDYLVGLVSVCYLTLVLNSAIAALPLLGQFKLVWPRLLPLLPIFGQLAILFSNWNRVIDTTVELRRSLSESLTLPFAVFLVFNLCLGMTLFDLHRGISTPWANNYGDLTFHVGQITSFVFGANFPPEYPVFAGVSFSYPMFINLWTATLWSIYPSWYLLDLIFTVQWVVLWGLLYWAICQRGYSLIPWAILFGGGSYSYLLLYLSADEATRQGLHAHAFLAKGLPWTPFLTTLWVTQRSFLFGLVVGAFVLKEGLDTRKKLFSVDKLLIVSLLLGLSLLVHTHLVLFLALFFLILVIREELAHLDFRRKYIIRKLRVNFLIASLAAGLWAVFIPLLWGKTETLKFVAGWMPWDVVKAESLEFPVFGINLANSILAWSNNAWPVFLLFCLMLYLRERSSLTSYSLWSIAALFVVANFIQLAIWEWDQLKVFVTLYLVLLFLVSKYAGRNRLVLECSLLLLIVPGLVESVTQLTKSEDFVIYSPEDLKAAREILSATAPCSVIAAKPDHNSPITLTGRRLFSGYGGTLHSHGLNYENREKAQNAFEFAGQSANFKHCGVYAYKLKPGLGSATAVANLELVVPPEPR